MQLRTYRKIHRYLGIVIGIQLLLWTASGLFFALNPIEKVRGETEAAQPSTLPISAAAASPSEALDELAARHDGVEILSVVLRPHLDGAVYEIAFRQAGEPRWMLADAGTGRLRPPVSRDEAVAIARRDFAIEAEVASVELVTAAGEGSEYRGRPLPAYRVDFDHALGTRIYVSTDRGTVTARRNDRWRLFDLLWMLHIMDYSSRTDFNSWWLQAVSGLGLATVVSGFVLAWVTSPSLRRRKPSVGRA